MSPSLPPSRAAHAPLRQVRPIYHYLNGVRYTDATKTTNTAGQIALTQSFGPAGQRTYYVTFAGDTSYKASTSGVVTITVH